MAAIERAFLIGLMTLATVASLYSYPCQIKRLMHRVEDIMARSIRGAGGPDVTTERIIQCK